MDIIAGTRNVMELLWKMSDFFPSNSRRYGDSNGEMIGGKFLHSCSVQSLQASGGLRISLCCGKAVESHSLSLSLLATFTILKHVAQLELSSGEIPLRRNTVESLSLGVVLSNTFTVLKHVAQIGLSACMSLRRKLPPQGGRVAQPRHSPAQHLGFAQT
jgi:hypothetical protein